MLVKPGFEETCVWLAKPSVQIFTLLDATNIAQNMMRCTSENDRWLQQNPTNIANL